MLKGMMGIPRSGDSRRSPPRPPPARPRARRRSWRSHLGSTNLNDDTRQGETPSPTVATTRSWKVERGSGWGSGGEQTWVPKRDEGRRAVRRSRGKMRTSRPLPRVSSSSRRAIAPRRATHDSSCVSCRSKCPREPTSTALNGGPRAPVRSIEAKRVTRANLSNRNLHHTTDTRAMSSATKPRRSINGGKSPSYGRDHSPPPGREMAVKNHRRGTRHPPHPPRFWIAFCYQPRFSLQNREPCGPHR